MMGLSKLPKLQDYCPTIRSSLINIPRILNDFNIAIQTNSSIQHSPFTGTHVNGFKYSKGFNDGSPSSIATQGQSGPSINGNREAFHYPQSSRTQASPSDSSESSLEGFISPQKRSQYISQPQPPAKSVCLTYETLTCTSTPVPSRPGSNCNKGVLHISLGSRTGALPSGTV